MSNRFAKKQEECKNTNDPVPYHYMDVWTVPPDIIYHLHGKERKVALLQFTHTSENGPFPPNSLTRQAPISFTEEAMVLAFLFVGLGCPLIWVFSMIRILLFCDWNTCVIAIIFSLILAFHPLPSIAFSKKYFLTSKLVTALFKYFSYRFVWCGDAIRKCEEAAPWIGAAPPHGVMPFANILSIPGINIYGIDFVGAPASVVMNTPFLRYLTIFPTTPVNAKSIQNSIEKGVCVGIVPDGIAGIFRQDHHKEVVALKNRKGLARLALRHGINIVPAYSFGNTSAFSAWWDKYGILESVSRKCQASFFIYWGRFGLPIPRRCQVTMVFSEPIMVEKVDHPTTEQISILHDKILSSMRECFEAHKHALGWGDKELIFD